MRQGSGAVRSEVKSWKAEGVGEREKRVGGKEKRREREERVRRRRESEREG